MCLELLERSSSVNVDKVNALLEECTKTVNERCDVNDSVLNQISTILVDLYLLLGIWAVLLYFSVLIRFDFSRPPKFNRFARRRPEETLGNLEDVLRR